MMHQRNYQVVHHEKAAPFGTAISIGTVTGHLSHLSHWRLEVAGDCGKGSIEVAVARSESLHELRGAIVLR